MITFTGWRKTNWCCPLVATEPIEESESPVLCLVTGPETSVEFPLVAILITLSDYTKTVSENKYINCISTY